MPGKCYKNLSDQAIVLVQNKDVKSGKICCSLEKMCQLGDFESCCLTQLMLIQYRNSLHI